VAVDIRGTIETRLQMLDEGRVDALVMAKAALIRLGIERSTENLIGPIAPLQGRLAIIAREEDVEMRLLFSSLA
jgi:porphobilinogen deaminase